VDVDEVMEEGCTERPAEMIWPYLLKVFQTVYGEISENLTLPFMLHCIFIGDVFFSSSETDATKITARSLDAIHTLSSIERTKSVKFRADQGKIYALNLSTCFPVFLPIRLADLREEKAPIKPGKVTQKIVKMSETANALPHKDELQRSAESTSEHRVKLCPMDQTLTYTRGDENLLDAEKEAEHSVSGLRSGDHRFNKRRVSFGVIRAIPSIDENSKKYSEESSDNIGDNNSCAKKRANGFANGC